MLTFDEAVALLETVVAPLRSETVPIAAAADRFLAEPLAARSASPARSVSAMDGYAISGGTETAGQWFDLVGENRPGAEDPGSIAPYQAVRVLTGAPVPQGTDCVVMQEYAERDCFRVRFAEGYGPATHIRAAGSDFAAGDVLVAAGERLTPRAMIAAAAADRAECAVFVRPRMSIIATGDELAPPGTSADRPGSVPESASYGVAALCEALGGEVVGRFHGRDTIDELELIAGEALAVADCIVVTGGASVGDYDLARPMFEKHGLEHVFGRIAIKPGKPVWLGKAGGKLVLGLPGNPTSAMVTARLFLQPLLAAMQGGSIRRQLGFVPMPLGASLPQSDSRETFVRARSSAEGLLPVENQESGAQSPLVTADWLIRRPANSPPVAAGDLVLALPF